MSLVGRVKLHHLPSRRGVLGQVASGVTKGFADQDENTAVVYKPQGVINLSGQTLLFKTSSVPY